MVRDKLGHNIVDACSDFTWQSSSALGRRLLEANRIRKRWHLPAKVGGCVHHVVAESGGA